MEQYKRSGPPLTEKAQQTRDLKRLIEELEQRVAAQSLTIESLERDLRKLRNEMRVAVSAVNTINSNNRRNG